jgi:glutaredoxin
MSKQPSKMLELYQWEGCPYCRRVREKLTELEMSYVIHNVPDKSKRQKVIELSGQSGVPTLVDPNTDPPTVIGDDDEEIIKYLEKSYT